MTEGNTGSRETTVDGTVIYRRQGRSGRWSAIERIALHDVLDDEPMGVGPPFPCRVVWRWSWSRVWGSSCRGEDYDSEAYYFEFESEAEAIEWLKQEVIE